MLDTLNIQNVALIPNLKLDLGAGLNVLTGETGSGKSIIIGSLNFVLGDRADKTMIRNGANFAKVEAVFSTNHSVNVNQTLNELGIIPDEYTIISRLITIEGRSDCRVNGSLVTAQMLKLITSQLVDIHGQHEHQSLLKVKNHIDILDNFAGAGLKTYKDNLIKAYDEHTFIIAQIDSLGGSDAERKSEADILQYQINEIEKLYLNEAEEEELINTISRLNNIERIANGINGAFVVLDGTDSMGVNSLLNSAITSLNSSVKYDNSLNLISERLNSVKIELGDITETLNEYASSLNYNQKEFDRLDSRLDSIKIAKKKYGGSIKEVFKFLESAKKRADLIEHSVEIYDKLLAQKELTFKKMYDLCVKIYEVRKSSAEKLEGLITVELNELGMVGAQFKVCFTDAPKLEEAQDKITKNGFEQVEFMFSANTGELVKSLSKIISGGEMSRFMLALKSIIADLDDIPTMVFDEIDTGISGKIGQVVATKFAKIAKRHQVISVSHLPQIAAMADKHYLVSKSVIDGVTIAKVNKLNFSDELVEIARLIGGSDIGTYALPHASEMKNWSNSFKQQIM